MENENFVGNHVDFQNIAVSKQFFYCHSVLMFETSSLPLSLICSKFPTVKNINVQLWMTFVQRT